MSCLCARYVEFGEGIPERSLKCASSPTRISLARRFTALEAAGHDVVWVRIAALGTTDPDVLAWATDSWRLDHGWHFCGISCALPNSSDVEALARQPMREEELLTGPLESTNEWYAVAKIAGLKLCQAYRRQYGADFISLMPTNLYGPGDNYHPDNSHVLPALIRRVHESKRDGMPTVTVWGTGTPRREFLFVDDLADACVFVLERYTGESHLNVGSGQDVTIADVAKLIAEVIG